MMTYEARVKWIRDLLCWRQKGKLKPGWCSNVILATVDVTNEMVQIGDNHDIELYSGQHEGEWFIEVYKKSTEREFTFYINRV